VTLYRRAVTETLSQVLFGPNIEAVPKIPRTSISLDELTTAIDTALDQLSVSKVSDYF
jgi:hypothetical protein